MRSVDVECAHISVDFVLSGRFISALAHAGPLGVCGVCACCLLLPLYIPLVCLCVLLCIHVQRLYSVCVCGLCVCCVVCVFVYLCFVCVAIVARRLGTVVECLYYVRM